MTADGFQVLQGHDQNRPDDHDHEKLKDADRIVINDAADNTTEDVVLYLVQGDVGARLRLPKRLICKIRANSPRPSLAKIIEYGNMAPPSAERRRV